MIDASSLIAVLPLKRWFGGKGRGIARIEVVDEVVVDGGAPALVFAILSVELSDGSTDLYSVPLLVDDEGRARDAIEDLDRLRVMGRLMTQGETIRGRSGRFHFGGPGLDPRTPPGTSSIRLVGAEQTNTSVVLDEDVIVKLFRRVESGPNPDLELNRLLTNEGYENIPAHVGEILYEADGEGEAPGREIDLGIAQQLVTDAREGWQDALAHLAQLLDGAEPHRNDVEAVVDRHTGKNLDDIARLGDVTASLHVTLAREELEPDVASEIMDPSDVKTWVQSVGAWLERAAHEDAEHVGALRDAIQRRLDECLLVDDPGRKIRIHGDFHLGQVLLAPRGWMILDFEGEPLRPIEERRAKQSALKDVAGMLRSLSYAAAAALFARAEPGSGEWTRLEPRADAWERLARERFLTAYLRTSHEGRFLPRERAQLNVMLGAFEIEKALYELDYERGHRPQWTRIPLRGIAKVLEREGRR